MLLSSLQSGGWWQPPQRCVLCHDLAKQLYLCCDCEYLLQRLHIEAANVCPLCAKVSVSGVVCGQCQQAPPHFDQLWASYRLAAPLHQIIQQYKFHQQWSYVRALSAWMRHAMPPWLSNTTFDSVVAMPLSRERLIERGFNQSQLLLDTLIDDISLASQPVSLLTITRKHRPPQSILNHQQRIKNVQGVFDLKSDVSKRKVLLIDDVVTTSATLNELARMLKQGGAVSVSCWVIART